MSQPIIRFGKWLEYRFDGVSFRRIAISLPPTYTDDQNIIVFDNNTYVDGNFICNKTGAILFTLHCLNCAPVDNVYMMFDDIVDVYLINTNTFEVISSFEYNKRFHSFNNIDVDLVLHNSCIITFNMDDKGDEQLPTIRSETLVQHHQIRDYKNYILISSIKDYEIIPGTLRTLIEIPCNDNQVRIFQLVYRGRQTKAAAHLDKKYD
jgi:hypothetical protein